LNLVIKLTLFIGCCTGIFQLAWAGAALWPESVIVVTSSQRPAFNINRISINRDDVQPVIQILKLDAVTNIEQRLSEGLPVDPAQARTMVDQRIMEIGRTQLNVELRVAYLPLGTMMVYAIDRYPVIILDQRTVIYGVTDLTQAINRYRQWVKDQQVAAINE